MKRTIKAVRETIWQMDSPSDLVNVLTSIQQQLQLQNIAYETIGVNVIDPATELPVSKYVLFKGDDLVGWRLWQGENIASDLKGNGARLETCWRSGKSIYRTDLNKEDRYDERAWIEEQQRGRFGQHTANSRRAGAKCNRSGAGSFSTMSKRAS
jgi:hypothetical protein